MSVNRIAWLKIFMHYCMSFMLLVTVSLTAAAEVPDSCDYAYLQTAFKEYVTTIDQAQVETIQKKLNASGYGEIAEDGVLGLDTRQALQRFCQTFPDIGQDDIAMHLVALLDINSVVIVDYPEWRETVVSDGFNRWVGKQSEERQAQIRQTVAAGPAEQIVEFLGQFSAAINVVETTAATAEAQPAVVETPPKPIELLPESPAVYYQWLPLPEPPADELKAAIAEVLNKISGIIYSDKMVFLKAVDRTFNGSDLAYNTQQHWILEQAQRRNTNPLKQIELGGGDCGCSRDFSNLVYGFYPYWQAEGELQSVDFSLYDRISLYAVTLDKAGTIGNPLQWSNDWNAAAFINKAHKYRVAVDVTVYANGWQEWSDEVLENAARSAAVVAKQRFTTRDSDSIADFISTIGDPSSVQGDGITVVFNGYTESLESSRKIVKFITQLSGKLNPGRTPDGMRVNLMLGIDMDFVKTTLDQVPKQTKIFEQLSDILVKDEKGGAMVDYLFIPLQEPTSRAKKILRQEIDEEFQDRGKERMEVLRKIVPVLPSAGHDKQPRGPYIQFKDDLIYFENNFAGVALWPMSLVSDESHAMIKKMVVDEYTDGVATTLIESIYVYFHVATEGSVNDIYATTLCSLVCPNRWWFLVGVELLTAAALIFALLCIWVSRLRDLTKKYFWAPALTVMVIVTVFVMTLVCDPAWHQRADAVLISVLLAGIIYSLWKFISKATQPPLP